MPRQTFDSRFGLLLVSSLVACVAHVGGCSSNDGGIETTQGGGPGTGGRVGAGGNSPKGGGPATTGGAGEVGGAAGMNSGDGGASTEGGAESVEGGTSSTGGTKSGAGGAATGGASNGEAGTSAGPGVATGGVGAEGGNTGSGGGGGTLTEAGAGGTNTGQTSCVYFSKGGEVVEQGGAGGAGPSPTITVLKNAFAGTYLADGAGKALYTYGGDAPGDCNYTPITTCFLDCIIAWPVFNGEPRVLAAGLDDSMFGSIERTDGSVTSSQTTYMGWPLYYYKNDALPGDVKGHAVGRIWNIAQVIPSNIVVIRIGTVRFIADEGGHTLYTSVADTKGTMTNPPVSACTGSCLDDFEPFVLTYLSPVSYLLPSDFSYFVRSDGAPQIAYKGAPLYLSHADLRSTHTNGTAIAGWSVAAP